MSSILAPKFIGNRRPTSAPKHQNHPQSKKDGTIQLLFRQLRSCQSSTIPLPNLCRVESKLQTYINKLKLDIENTRKDCQSQVEMLQKTIGNLRSTLLRFEDLSSESDHCGPVSILGSMNCQSSGCFFRSDKPDELQRHIETGLHCRLQLQNFVVIHGISIEAVSAPKTASDTESCQMVIAEHVNTSMKPSAIPNDANPPSVSLELQTIIESVKEHIFSLTNKAGGEHQYCPNPPNGCGLRFQHLKDFKEHYDSEAGKACVKSRLIAFSLPYFDHKRVDDKPRQTSTIPSPFHVEAPGSNTPEASKVPNVSSFTGRTSPIPARTHSTVFGSRIPLVNEATTFDFPHRSLALTSRKLLEDLYSEKGISMCQQTTRASEYSPSNDSFGPFGFVEETRDIGLRIEGYTPTRGMADDILQVKVGSFVPLLCAVFNIQIGFFVQPEPRLQNLNAILASVEEERISPTSFYRYTVSARVPYPENQPRMFLSSQGRILFQDGRKVARKLMRIETALDDVTGLGQRGCRICWMFKRGQGRGRAHPDKPLGD
ncbi:uncharacterized protein PAC_18871 [Phialocephala subalpina]|uniref:Uncharacterized protein n=1 Tax=Phialocephala subalpina TaxID=576137 RepID=A0A1L7XVG2_9HELO|nr:uncharacterized protein PAC_18871 [Phialocephala subalpina]